MGETGQATTIDHRVPDDITPERIDRYLASQPDLKLSRTRVQQLLDNGAILVNGRPVVARYQVKGGEAVTITLPAPAVTRLTAEDLPLEIVYQDKHLAVVNKPAGMATHPAPGNRTGTLVNALLHHFGSLPAGSSAERPGIVHRLDKDTTGLLLIARDEPTHRTLQAAIASRDVHRSYLALVWGHMVDPEGEIDAPIGRSPKDRKRMAVVTTGRGAITHYRRKERFRSYDLLDVDLETGRTHQIRVHLAHLGHPVFGDPDYGGRDKSVKGLFAPERPLGKQLLAILPRQALHAQTIRLIHPVSGKTMEFSVPPPADFQQVLDLLYTSGH